MTNTLALVRWRFAAVVAVLLAVVGPLSALSAEAAGPVQWKATVGVSSPNQAIQSNFFFPSNITVDVGDSVLWTMKSGEFHTVTFLSGGDAPPLITASGINPAVLFAAGGPDYDGTGYVNSGLMSVTAPKTFTLKFTTPGTYQYNCLVHTTMKGWIHVQPGGTPYPHSQAYYNSQAAQAEGQSIAAGYRLRALGLVDALTAGAGHVTAGIGKLYGDGSVAILSFLPKMEVVHVGQTVNWNNRDPEFPHTITFNLEGFDDPNLLAAFVPIGTDGPGHATIGSTAQDVNSGVLVAGGPTQFNVKFTAPGVYNYYCALHDELGMKGTVVVLPGS